MVKRTQADMEVSLVSLETIRPHERHDPDHALELVHEISQAQAWLVPIIIEKQDRIILDGHHRFNAARMLGLHYIPAVEVDYDDQSIEVSAWRKNEIITRNHVISAGCSGNLLPIKTSRHRFINPLPTCHFSIQDLFLKSAA